LQNLDRLDLTHLREFAERSGKSKWRRIAAQIEGPSNTYDFRSYVQSIQNDLGAQGYKTTLKVSDQNWSMVRLSVFRDYSSN
jgi:hypothetical protein